MNTGQTLLTIGAMVLLGTIVIGVNRNLFSNGVILTQTEVGIYAISLASSIIEEASGQNYDEVTVNDAVTATTSLSLTLGPEAGETTNPVTTTNFDDFDDYNNLDMPTTVSGIDNFRIKAQEVYINAANPEGSTTTPTWYKKINVSVIPTVSQDTIKMSYIFSYFNFR
jgi:hypothetical protein